ncbi:MAG: DNA methylation and regulatory protein Ada [Nitrospira sp.]
MGLNTATDVQVRIRRVRERPFAYIHVRWTRRRMCETREMNIDDPFYQAVVARDRRFDGRLFVAVKTTGIYCRPICPARPKRENVEFFKTAHAAERAGYRPCLRCRPESAPGSPAWNGKQATIERALKLIAQGALEGQTEEMFADRLGVTARHLRRLFEKELGQTPKQLHDGTRLNFARKLIVETPLPFTEIAFSAGFRSLRRFNDAVKKRFHRPPSALRSSCMAVRATPLIRLALPYRPPLDWHGLLNYYRSHQVSGVETIEGETYARVFRLGDKETTGFFRARPCSKKPELILEICLSDTRHLLSVAQRIRHMFDLDADPTLIAKVFEQSSVLATLQNKHQGVRLARGFDPFETAIATIIGQVISVVQASRLMSQLAASYGEEIRHPLSGDRVRIFPGPLILAESDLRDLAVTDQKRATIREFSARVAEGTIQLEPMQDLEEFKRRVRTVKGIGVWSAEYMALRALGDTDAFPATDLILSRFVKANPQFNSDVVRPWRSYAAVGLWNEQARASVQERRKGHAAV